jgi:hypothetical protein
VYDYIIIYKEIMNSSVIDKDPVAETDTVEVTEADAEANTKSAVKVTEADAHVEANKKTAVKVTEAGADVEEDASEVNETDAADDQKKAEDILQQLPDEIKKELDDDNLMDYSNRVKMRLEQMKKAWHDERRVKEAAEREKGIGMGYHSTQGRKK